MMHNTRTAWIAVVCMLALGAGLSALARDAKAKPLNVTYYYLPG